MNPRDRVEQALEQALEQAIGPGTPPRLAEALRYAVFPGGGRARPQLVLAVADACGRVSSSAPVDAAAAAVELLHCASLVHDDLPCFDDASMRRGRPAVHLAYGSELAVLVGDGLIVAAFETLAEGCARAPRLMGPLVRAIGAGVGTSGGIVAGQAWESEPALELATYHRAKTGALFEAAARAGAIVGGGAPNAWALLGRRIGEAYQVADDIADAVGSAAVLGKPVGRDAVFDRPSAARSMGVHGAMARLEGLREQIVASVPPCPDRRRFEGWARELCTRVLPSERSEPRAVPSAFLELAVATA